MNAWTQRRRSDEASNAGVILPSRASAPAIAGKASASDVALTHDLRRCFGLEPGKAVGFDGRVNDEFHGWDPRRLPSEEPQTDRLPNPLSEINDPTRLEGSN